ncbi:GTP cyclohydrolase II [Halalkalibacter lacteus]|uniref:GTP cyclohydrolase II n=1 Tax=Halalkalibacter lacteus TaxID=3090663 RepID=UPI002FC7F49F
MDVNTFRLLESKINLIKQDNKKIALIGPVKMPLDVHGKIYTFSWFTWINIENDIESVKELLDRIKSVPLAHQQHSSVLTYGEFSNAEDANVRFHSICHTGDVFGSKRCDCGEQFKEAKSIITEKGTGAIFYLADQEGRGIGLFNKAMAYLLQENGLDTVEANLALGFEDDLRIYDEAAIVLKHLRKLPISIITNNPDKRSQLESKGIKIKERIPVWCSTNSYNERYLTTKINKSGHLVT